MLGAFKPMNAEDDEYVFSGSGGRRPISYHNFRTRGFEPARKAAGLPDSVTVHSLTHAAASLLIAGGNTAVEVAEHLGHADSNVTLKVYAHLFDRDAREEKRRAAFDVLRSEGDCPLALCCSPVDSVDST